MGSIPAFILRSTAPFRWLIGAQFFINVILAADLSLRPYLLKTILNRISDGGSEDALYAVGPLAGLYILLGLVIMTAFRLYGIVHLQLQPRLKKHVGLMLMDRMMQHSHRLFQNNFSGSLANKIYDAMWGVTSIVRIFIDKFFGHTLAIFMAAYAVSFADIRFAVAMLVWIAVYMAGSYFFSKKAKILSENSAHVRSNVFGQVVDILTNVMNVRLFGGRQHELKHLGHLFEEALVADQQRDWYGVKVNAFQGFSFIAFQSLCLLWLLAGLTAHTLTPGDFALILTINISINDCLWSLSQDMREFSESWGLCRKASVSYIRTLMFKISLKPKNLMSIAERLRLRECHFVIATVRRYWITHL